VVARKFNWRKPAEEFLDGLVTKGDNMQSTPNTLVDPKAAHEKRVADLREANAQAEQRMALPPTPTQEENDLLALGLMDIDAKAGPKEPSGGGARGEVPHPRETTPATTATTAPRRV
jgi:hypothetical protein